MKLSLRIADIRRATQFFGLLLCNVYLRAFAKNDMYKGPLKSTCLPFIYCHSCPSTAFACPIGTIQHYAVIQRVPFFLLGHLGLIGLLVGRMACGWLCPFGLIQDLLHKFKTRKITLPKLLFSLRYVSLLLLVLLIPYFTGEHWFSKLCPLGTLVAGLPWVLWNPKDLETGHHVIASAGGVVGILFVIKIILLLLVIGLSVVSKRPFCRIACPLGLMLSFFNRVSLVKLEVNTDNCDGCDACREICPVDIKIQEDVDSTECVRCLKCTFCPNVRVTTRKLDLGHDVPLSALRRGRNDDQSHPRQDKG